MAGFSKSWVRGALWMGLYLALTLAPLLIVLAGATQPRREFARELSVALGFIGLAMMGLQFVLTARFKWLKSPYGSDVVYSFHRQISLIAFAFILAHPVLLALVDWPAVRIRFDFINHPTYPRFGFFALLPSRSSFSRRSSARASGSVTTAGGARTRSWAPWR